MNQHFDLSDLADTEHHKLLLSKILGNDSEKYRDLAHNLLCRFGSIVGLANADPVALLNVKDMTTLQIERLKSAVQLSRCLTHSGASNPTIDTPEVAFSLFKPVLTGLLYEEMHLLCLNRSKKLLLHRRISSGSHQTAVADPRQILSLALQIHADEIILGHNHPSGDPTPSIEDKILTRRIAMSALVMGITLLDHIIVGGNDYESLSMLGELPPSGEALSFLFNL